MSLAGKLIEHIKKLEKFSVYVLGFGLRLAIGLMVLSALFFVLTGRFGNYVSALSCARGALDTAPAVVISAVAAALISDLVIKDRARRS